MDTQTLVLTRRDVADLLGIDDCIAAVENAFRAHAERRSIPPGVLGVHVEGGGFHVKTAGLTLDRPYFAAKVNANFPGNRDRFGLPTIQGVIALFDATSGRLLALLDSIEITILRTAAATAVAARHLARNGASVVTIVGCGEQGRSQLRALSRVRPIHTVHALDTDAGRARRYAAEMGAELGVRVEIAGDLRAALRTSDLAVTCTPSTAPLIGPDDAPPGIFIAGVGADSETKQELHPLLLARSTVVVDILDQCAAIGDLHHALAAGAMTRDDVHAELGDIIVGAKRGRTSDAEVIVFDSTGTALQDVAAAALTFERAVAAGRGTGLPPG